MYIVELAPKAFKALSEYLPEYSILIPVWRDFRIVMADGKTKAMVLSCDEKQVEAMLCMANVHYPAATPMIQETIDRSRSLR